MTWYIRLGAFVITIVLVAPFILKALKLKDKEKEDR